MVRTKFQTFFYHTASYFDEKVTKFQAYYKPRNAYRYSTITINESRFGHLSGNFFKFHMNYISIKTMGYLHKEQAYRPVYFIFSSFPQTITINSQKRMLSSMEGLYFYSKHSTQKINRFRLCTLRQKLWQAQSNLWYSHTSDIIIVYGIGSLKYSTLSIINLLY